MGARKRVLCLAAVLAFAPLTSPLAAASIEGVVVENRTGKPLARTRVTIEVVEGAVQGGNFSVLTDTAGRFRFNGLTAGTYQLVARRSGFVSGKFGQTSWDSPGSPVTLGERDSFHAELRLFRPGAVSGEIVDENRVGLPNCPVYAFRIENRPRLVGHATTDDLGRYRISGLQPGEYLIASAGRVLEDGTGLLSTFYGQVVARNEATRIPVYLEEETTGINIRPVEGTPGTIIGTVLDGANAVTLLSDYGNLNGEIKAGKSFEFSGLSPGQYEVLAEGGSSGEPMAALERVHVVGGVNRVALQLGPLPVVEVDCAVRGGGSVRPELVVPYLRRKGSPEDPPRRVQCGKPERFAPGDWVFWAHVPADRYLESVGGAGLLTDGFEISLQTKQHKRVSLVLAGRPGSLVGEVKTEDGHPAIGAPVFLRAPDRDLGARIGGAKRTITDTEGRWRFDGLPPGRYELISSFRLKINDLSSWTDGSGKNLELAEGESRSVVLSLFP